MNLSARVLLVGFLVVGCRTGGGTSSVKDDGSDTPTIGDSAESASAVTVIGQLTASGNIYQIQTDDGTQIPATASTSAVATKLAQLNGSRVKAKGQYKAIGPSTPGIPHGPVQLSALVVTSVSASSSQAGAGECQSDSDCAGMAIPLIHMVCPAGATSNPHYVCTDGSCALAGVCSGN